MKKENRKYNLSLLVELVCCLIGCVAFCSALLPAFGQEVSVMDCVLFAAVDITLIFLLSRRWWLTPLILAAVALLGGAAVHYFHLWDTIREYVQGFADWVNAAYPYTLPYSENGSRFLVHLALSFPVALLLYLYFRRFPFLPVGVVLGGGLLVWLYFADPERMVATAALLLIVLFALISRANARSINKKLGGTEKIPAAAMQLTALALAPLVLLFAVVIGPKEERDWQSQTVFDFVEDLSDVVAFYGEGSTGGGSFSLAYSGLTPNGSGLGGDIEPDNRAVMRVRTTTPILLAGAVFDGYDGVGWYDAGNLGRFRLDSPLWRGKRREVYVTDKPSGGRTAETLKAVTLNAVLEVSMNVRFRSLFTNGKLESLRTVRGDELSVYFNTQGELFTLDFPSTGATYEIRTRVFDRSKPDYDENMRLLAELAAAGNDGQYAQVSALCTAVPDTVEPAVRDLAAELTAGCTNDYDKALAIERWIGENCAYTRTPGDVPAGRDFVSYFLLDSREGYCTYYASAMAVMARLAGLPARYVTGYGLKQADGRVNTDSYIATNATAHAWAQVYLYGVGWVDFDPMQWNAFEQVVRDEPAPEEPKEEKPETPIVPEFIEPQIELPELPPLEPASAERPTPRRQVDTGKILLIFLGCDAAAFLIFLLVRFILLFFRVESFYYRLTRKYPDNAARVDVCYRQILKQLGFLGLTMEPADTILSFCERADAALGSDPPHDSLLEVCEPVLLSRFALREPADGELRRMCDFYIFLERSLRRKLGLRRYILHRMILGR